MRNNFRDKIKSRDELSNICKTLKAEGKIIGFTSGAFDLLHVGHVDYLYKSKNFCDVLIVAVNSDQSVKKYKGDGRPIIRARERAQLVAALEFVDYVFIFDERRNKINIEALRPDLYIKAGDYSEEQLTSKDVVESIGGKVKLIPVAYKISTSDIIKKALQNSGDAQQQIKEVDRAVHIDNKSQKKSPAVFIDRDGTINEEIGFLHEPEKFVFLPDVLEGLKKFQDMGYKIIIITNQGGIGLGYYTKEDFYKVNSVMLKAFSKAGIVVDKIYFCPHSLSENCECRKPELGLIRLAEEQLNIDLSNSIFIGDRTVDIETARRAGCRSILVRTGIAGKDGEYDVEPDFIANSVLEAAEILLEKEHGE